MFEENGCIRFLFIIYDYHLEWRNMLLSLFVAVVVVTVLLTTIVMAIVLITKMVMVLRTYIPT